MTSSKSIKKAGKRERALVIYRIGQHYNVTDTYVRQIIRGEGDSELAQNIREDFNRLYKAVEDVFKNK